MSEEYDLRTNRIVLAGKLRKSKRLQEEVREVTEEISELNSIIREQKKEVK